jgi:serine/threonine-protein kinase
MIGRTLIHYEITAKLGAGAMGEVWRATDSRLDREVALKVLPEELATDPERLERFEREAKAIAALNHPNIVTIHSVEKAGGIHLLTMELVEGQSLDQLLPAGGFELDRLFPLAIQIADALTAAHEKGIIHRDLKPANVMVTGEGRVKVLDFGLAKLAEMDDENDEAEETQLMTQAGMVLGTVPYMSPEQVQAKPVDHRSDVFSLGTLLYEMACGERPFRGDNSASVISAVLKDQPPSVSQLRATLPNHLGRIIQRCLEKDPERRHQSAKEVRNELEGLRDEVRTGHSAATPTAIPAGKRRLWPAFAVGAVLVAALAWWVVAGRGGSPGEDLATRSSGEQTASAQSERPRLVVIPFENLGAEDDDYFAAGMTEEITSRLAAVSDLAVISRKSALQYAGTDKTPAEIGQELDVAYVLDGTVRWAASSDGGSRVRITPQLISVAADTAVWSEPFDREVEDVFEIQTEIAKTVVSELGIAVLGGVDSVVADRPTVSFEAYQAFLRGQHLREKGDNSRESRQAMVGAFAKAVELDPDFGEAWAALTSSHAAMYHHGYDVSEARRELARQALAQADRLAPNSGETLLAHGYYHYWGFKQYEEASEYFRRARAVLVDPSNALVAEGFVLRRLARFDEAVALLEKALENNPRDTNTLNALVETLIFTRRYSEAVETSRLAQSIDPFFAFAAVWEALAHRAWKGADGLAAARDALDRVRGDHQSSLANHHRLRQLFYEGREEDVLEFVKGLGEFVRASESTYPSSLMQALALERLGRNDEARAAYRRAASSLEQELERTPDNFRLYGPLGYAYAALGRPAEALAAAERGHEMLPLKKDALRGADRLWELAVVNARLGNAAAAIDQYRTLIEFTGAYSVPLLEIDFFMDPVRDHPKYKELIRDLG